MFGLKTLDCMSSWLVDGWSMGTGGWSQGQIIQTHTRPIRNSEKHQELMTKWGGEKSYQARIAKIWSIWNITLSGSKENGDQLVVQAYLPVGFRNIGKKRRHQFKKEMAQHIVYENMREKLEAEEEQLKKIRRNIEEENKQLKYKEEKGNLEEKEKRLNALKKTNFTTQLTRFKQKKHEFERETNNFKIDMPDFQSWEWLNIGRITVSYLQAINAQNTGVVDTSTRKSE